MCSDHFVAAGRSEGVNEGSVLKPRTQGWPGQVPLHHALAALCWEVGGHFLWLRVCEVGLSLLPFLCLCASTCVLAVT